MADAIPRQVQRSGRSVPERNGERPLRETEDLVPVVFEQMHSNLRIAGRLERVPPGQKLGPNLRVVEQLPVERDPDVACFVRQGLTPLFEIDDRETTGTQREAGLDMVPFLIGAAVRDGTGHPGQTIRLESPIEQKVDCPDDAAHRQDPFSSHGDGDRVSGWELSRGLILCRRVP